MNADAGKDGDLALVYREEIQNANADSIFSQAIFPSTVTLPQAVTDYVDVRYSSVDENIMFDCWGQLDNSRFMMDCYSETGEIRIEYESSDGITYTRTDGEETVDFGVEIHYDYPEYWNDAIGYFIQVGGKYFEGLYEYGTVLHSTHVQCSPLSSLTFDVNGTTVSNITYSGETVGGPVDIATIKQIHKTIQAELNNLYDTTYSELFYNTNNELCLAVGVYSAPRYFYTTANGSPLGFSSSQSCGPANIAFNVYKIDLEAKTHTLLTSVYGIGASKKYTPYTDIATIPILFYLGNDSDAPRIPYYWYIGTTPEVSPMATIYFSNELKNYPIYENAEYHLASTQLSLNKPDELLPGKIAYGKNGTVIGDGSIWGKNITLDILQSDFGFPVATKAASKYHSYKTTEPYSKCLTVMNQQAFKEKIENIEDDVVTKINISDFVSTDSKSYTWNRLSQYNGKIYGANALATTDIFYFVYDTVNSTGTFHRYTFPTKLNAVYSGVRDNKMYIFGYTTSNVYTFKLYILDLDTNQLLHEQTITQSSSITSNSVKISIPRIAGRADAYILTRGTSNSGNNYYYGYAINGTTVTTKLSLTNTTTYTGWMAFREGIAFLNKSLVVTAIDLEDTANTKTYTNTNSINIMNTVQNESLNGYIPVHRIGDGNDSVLFYNMNNSTFVVKSNIPKADMTIFDDYICVLYGRIKNH